MKAIAKLFETMLTKDATPTWGHQSGTGANFGAERSWGYGGAPVLSVSGGDFTA